MEQENLNENPQIPEQKNTPEITPEDVSRLVLKLKEHQDLNFAIAGGFLTMLVSAVIWAVITVLTKYQIGYMAIGVGFLVGFAVRFFGAGIDKIYGLLGAVFALLGCLLGNFFSLVILIAHEQSMGYFDVLSFLNIDLIMTLMKESFQPMDLLFYGFAVYSGYKYAFRPVTDALVIASKDPDFEPYPDNSKFRKPLAIVSIVVIAGSYFLISGSTGGYKTFYYETGEKMSEGELQNGLRQGKWIFWYQNGKQGSVGFYKDGVADSIWQWFSEQGNLARTGYYENGLESGLWISYYENGSIIDSGRYFEGRMSGLWVSYYENGTLMQKGIYNRNQQDSTWELYFDNGKLSSTGNFIGGEKMGIWKSYYDNGKQSEIVEYKTAGKVYFKDVWTVDGRKIVTNGNGNYETYSVDRKLLQKGKIENGLKTGTWQAYYEDGKLQEEGHYEKDVYLIDSRWDAHGKQTITSGSGTYTSYYPGTELIMENGVVSKGYKTGIWTSYYPEKGSMSQQLMYVNGKLNGKQKYFYQSGQLATEGTVIDDLRENEWTWYYEDGSVSSTVYFKHDKKDGQQLMYDETGEIIKEEIYEDGNLVSERVY